MGEFNELATKAVDSLKDEGVSMLIRRTKGYFKRKYREKKNKEIYTPDKIMGDVLFVNGCYLPHPSRYRVSHQREQLCAADMSSSEVFYTELTMDMARLYRVFIFFRCPYTEQIGEFIANAKKNNKVVLYDIDDLMIDKKYTKTIDYLKKMSGPELVSYYNGIELNQKLLKLCDGAITTTERLAKELKQFVPEVYINRNVASEEMLSISEKALKGKINDNNNQVRIGYFSGSITHNADIKMILPVLVNLMKKYPNLGLVLSGELDLPSELNEFKDRIEAKPFSQWKELPYTISCVDINIAPLEDTIFNEAKSENKWVEAALVKVPTIASNVGAFRDMIEDGVTGSLCSSLSEWEETLAQYIEDISYRNYIADNAYEFCKKKCTSIYTGNKLADYLKRRMNPNIVFVLPVLQISGGALVILKHCEMILRAGYDVTILNQGNEDSKYVKKDNTNINVVNFNDVAISMHIDKAVATLWTTVGFLEMYSKINQRYYNVQNFETDFYESGDGRKLDANRTYCSTLPMKYVTISKWCKKWLKDIYDKEAQYAPNGLDLSKFYPQRRNWNNRKIRILIEGNSNDYYKNVDESFKIIDKLDKNKYEIWFMSYQGKPKDWYYVDKFLHKVPYDEVPNIYRQCDILIKSSLLESFSYPPLEMMSTGGYVVVAPNDGNIEYLEDKKNCLFYNHAILDSAVDAIEELVMSENLQELLFRNGINTAREREWDYLEKEILSLYDIHSIKE